MKNFAHFGQMVTSGLMQKYNYGFWTNYMKYGQVNGWNFSYIATLISFFLQLTPPEYKIENMEVRTVVFWSPEDALASGRDVRILLSKLKNFKSFRIESFRHVDFLLSLEAEKVLFPKVLQILRECCWNNVRTIKQPTLSINEHILIQTPLKMLLNETLFEEILSNIIQIPQI